MTKKYNREREEAEANIGIVTAPAGLVTGAAAISLLPISAPFVACAALPIAGIYAGVKVAETIAEARYPDKED